MILLFGFSANPPHRGHLDVIRQAINAFPSRVTEIILVPCRKHPFGKALNDFNVVMKLTEAFAQDIKSETSIRTLALDLEGAAMALTKCDISYSADVVRMLNITKNCSDGILLCYGPDNKEKFDLFVEKEFLEKETTLFFAESRVKIRSTMIRECIKKGEVPPYTLTEKVEQCIKELPKNTFEMVK